MSSSFATPRPSYNYAAPAAPADYTVQGKSATSYEWNVAQALDKLGLPYMFQFWLAGGRRVRGGMILDFLVLTVPLSTPLLVNGDYFHKNSAKESMYTALVDGYFKGEAARCVVLWGEDSSTPEAALAAVKRELRV